MNNRVPAALAFYFRHAAEVDALSSLTERPATVAEEDWSMFLQVYGRACEQVEPWVSAARERGVAEVATRASVTNRSKKTIRRDWAAWAKLQPTKPPKSFNHPLYLGVCICSDPDGTPFFVPYLATSGRERVNLFERLDGNLPNIPRPPEWFSDDSVALRFLHVGPDSNPGAVVDESALCFGALAERWDAVFR